MFSSARKRAQLPLTLTEWLRIGFTNRELEIQRPGVVWFQQLRPATFNQSFVETSHHQPEPPEREMEVRGQRASVFPDLLECRHSNRITTKLRGRDGDPDGKVHVARIETQGSLPKANSFFRTRARGQRSRSRPHRRSRRGIPFDRRASEALGLFEFTAVDERFGETREDTGIIRRLFVAANERSEHRVAIAPQPMRLRAQ